MSVYSYKPLFPENLRTITLKERESKVKIGDFPSVFKKGGSFKEWLNSIPKILKGKELKEFCDIVIKAKQNKKAIMVGMGAHVIKVGLSPILIDLMENGYITSFSMNGACLIHDIEIALQGKTSEYVEKHLEKGTFGVTKETGEILNNAFSICEKENVGIGEATGRILNDLNPPYGNLSILKESFEMRIPVTVHIAIGTDVNHFHPNLSGEGMGKGSLRDFYLFSSILRDINDGGVFINIGSAVIIPEVFLKALTYVRNMEFEVKNFTTAVFDFIYQYRASKNVTERPVSESGRGFYFIGHHELFIPLLAGLIKESEND